MLNPLRDRNECMFIPGCRREDPCDHGLSRGLENKSDGYNKKNNNDTRPLPAACLNLADKLVERARLELKPWQEGSVDRKLLLLVLDHRNVRRCVVALDAAANGRWRQGLLDSYSPALLADASSTNSAAVKPTRAVIELDIYLSTCPYSWLNTVHCTARLTELLEATCCAHCCTAMNSSSTHIWGKSSLEGKNSSVAFVVQRF